MLNGVLQALFMWFSGSLLLSVGDSASSCRHWRNGASHTGSKRKKKGGYVYGANCVSQFVCLRGCRHLHDRRPFFSPLSWRCAPFRLAATRNRKHHGFPNPIVLTKKGVADWPNGISFAPGQGIGDPPRSERAESPTESRKNTPTAATKRV